MLRQDRHQAHDQRHLAVAALVEGEAHLARTGLLDLDDLLVIRAVIGPAVIAQQRVREDHVVDGDRRAVRELGRRVQRELDEASVGRRLDRLGDQPVKRERLVIGAREQALIDIVADAVGRLALHDQRIEAVIGALHGEGHAAAFRRVLLHVGKVVEAGRLARAAMHGDARQGLGASAARHGQKRQHQQ